MQAPQTDDFVTSPGSTRPGLLASVLHPFRDAWLGARAKLALLAARGGAAGDVAVEAFNGSLILTGDVADRRTRVAVERTVRSIPGVVGVTNRLRVRDELAPRGRSDVELAAELTRRLSAADELAASPVAVRAVYDGVVTLGGRARNAQARQAAFEIAIHTPGVRRVVSDVVLHAPPSGVAPTADAA